eukprot:TRINITY_DN8353_c1_g1_i1.p1 TRINITY_DN8353_c1_g1~~TRINITY_DN8353_c1_g1_i1.p1  ORF type:complete len:239 (+),score=49.37 TRINITY_DN8353_c1_g1_i1:185-901(+)
MRKTLGEELPVRALCIVGVNQKGYRVEWFKGEMTESLSKEIIACAVPDNSHKWEKDFCFFSVGGFYCVSCFRQLDARLGCDLKIDQQFVSKSVVAVCTKPIYGVVRRILEPCLEAYFSMGIFSDYTIFEAFFRSVNLLQSQGLDAFYQGVEFRNFVSKLKRNSLVLYKALWLGKRISFYGNFGSDVSEIVFALVSLVPYYFDSIFWREAEKEKEAKKIVFPSQFSCRGQDGLETLYHC